MPPQPDSMIAAAKKVAEIARLPWPAVQRTYRALQAANFLPISRGRSIWYAHPNLIGALLIGMACPEKALGERVELFQKATPNADGFEAMNFRNALSRLLAVPDAAADLAHIVFEIDSDRVVVVTHGGDADCTEVETRYHADPDAYQRRAPLIQNRTVISGDLIRALQAQVRWRLPSDAPYADEGEPAFERFDRSEGED